MRNIELTESDIALELLTGMGGELDINGVKIKPLSIGIISLLASIESPFVSVEEVKPNTKDLLDALYICYKGYDAVTTIYQAQRVMNKLEKTQLATIPSTDNYKHLTERLEAHSEAYESFDQQVFAFAEELGMFDAHMAVEWLAEQVNIGINGYKMVQHKDSLYTDEKKKQSTSLIYTGLTRQLPWWLRLVITVIKKLSGKYHLRK